MKRMLFNATHAEETRVGIVDGQKLIDIDIETAGREQRKSNIYKGIITRIEPSLEACFIDYGEERHGFLPFKEISRSYFKEGVDVRTATIREALSEGQELIVQVEKEERGNKGAALTTFISLAGRYLVLMPNNPRGGGVSRRIEGEERQELREAMEQLDLPAGMSTIARTAGIGRTVEELQWDLNYLLKLWNAISEAATPQYEYTVNERGRSTTHYCTESVRDGKPLKRANPAPFLIVEESNLVIRAIRDYFQPDIGEILVDTDDIYDQARQFMAHVMPDMVSRVKRYRDETPLFSRFQIEHQIETAYSRTVPLPSGGAIVIDHTEALVAVDVNSARATRGADIEETALRTNLEAADEVARQMRLRDLGGLIVIDFIDMSEVKNQRQIEQQLKEAIHPDRARVQIGRISRFGLMELSRQRLRPSLSEGSHITCPRCNGVGVIRDTESSALQVLRILQEEAAKEGTGALHAQVPVDVATFILNEKRSEIAKIEQRFRIPVVLIPNTSLETPHYHIERLRSDDERLDDDLASYKRAEDLSPVADDPYALKSASEDKPQRPKQVPVIKNVLPQEVAPVHTPRNEAKQEETQTSKGFFAKLLAFFGFGGEQEQKSEVKKTEKKPARGDRRGKGRRVRDEMRSERSAEKRRSMRGERRARPARDDAEPALKNETAAEAPKALNDEAVRTEEKRARRTRRPRREEPAAAAETVEEAKLELSQQQTQSAPSEPAVSQDVEADQTQLEAKPEETPAAPQPSKAEPQRRGRGERRQKKPQEKAEAAADDAATPAEAPLAQAVADAFEPAPEAQQQVPAASEDLLEIMSDAPENDAEPVIESDSRRRRPRRRRRATRAAEATTVTAAVAPVAMDVVKEAAAAAQDGEPLTQIETQALAPAEDQPEAQVQSPASDAAQQPASAPAQNAEQAEQPETRTEEQAQSESLVQIETSPEAMQTAAQEAVAAQEQTPRAGRAPSIAEPIEHEELVQIETAPQPELVQIETVLEEPAAAEPVTEPQQAPLSVEMQAEPHQAEIAVGLEENLAKAGLTQVHTDPALCQPVSYEAVKYPGRPRPELPALEEEPLEQVHTDPKYLA